MATRHIIQKVWILAILMLLTGCSRSTALPTPQPTATTAATPTGTSILSEFATISIHVPLVVRGGSRASDHLFEDISHRAGLLTCTPSYSAAWGDYDADGDPDLFVSNHGSPRSLYRNEGGGVFRDVAEAMGIPPKGHDSHGGVWGDPDADGDLDLYLAQGKHLGEAERRQNFYFRNDGVRFTDVAAELGIGDPGNRGRGVSWVDVNLDGYLDLFLVNFHSPLVLYLGDGAGGFTPAVPVPGEPGYGSDLGSVGVAWADYDGDGDLDAFLAGPNRLLRNETIMPGGRRGQGFTDVTEAAIRVSGPPSGQGAAWGDYDNDGDPDLYVVRGYEGLFDFVERWPEGVTFGGLAISDTDGLDFSLSAPVRLDLYHNGAPRRKHVFLGKEGANPDQPSLTLDPADKRFCGRPPIPAEELNGVLVWRDCPDGFWHLRWSGGGERSGFIGLLTPPEAVTGFQSVQFEKPLDYHPANRLFRNNGDGTFTDVASQAGVADTGNGRDASWADVDNDGDLDLYVVNSGDVQHGNEPNHLYLNRGDGAFEDATAMAGLAGPTSGRGGSAAWADYDRDGFLDLFVHNGLGPPPFSRGPHLLYHNQGNANHWLEIRLIGRRSNRQGVGARVTLTAGGRTQMREQNGGVHVLAQDDQVLHFGLGEATHAERIEVRWPSGIVQTVTDVPADRLITLVEPEG